VDGAAEMPLEVLDQFLQELVAYFQGPYMFSVDQDYPVFNVARFEEKASRFVQKTDASRIGVIVADFLHSLPASSPFKHSEALLKSLLWKWRPISPNPRG
jgi:hypothetical protein